MAAVESPAYLPLSPYEEGQLRGLAFMDIEESYMHFDGADHLSINIPTDVHESLAERSDFTTGLRRGVHQRHVLKQMGYAVTQYESDEAILLTQNHGGSE